MCSRRDFVADLETILMAGLAPATQIILHGDGELDARVKPAHEGNLDWFVHACGPRSALSASGGGAAIKDAPASNGNRISQNIAMNEQAATTKNAIEKSLSRISCDARE
jgi:hypothetical protein